jgi:arsenate reductase
MALKVYEYVNCSTCKKALKFLEKKGVKFESIPIVEKPPSFAELKRMVAYLESEGGSFKNLFNTSGQMYRELSISQKLKDGMTEYEALQLLSKNGKLIKRPFALTDREGAVGFKEDVWKKRFKST